MTDQQIGRLECIILIFLCFMVSQYIQVFAQTEIIFKKDNTFRVPAPVGISEKALGEGFDKDLSRAGRVFDLPTQEVKAYDYQAEESYIENDFELNANARFLFFNANVKVQESKRYAVLRMYQIVKVKQIEVPYDATYTGNAKLFVHRIYYGHTFEIIVEGDEQNLTTNLKAQLLKLGGDINSLASQRKFRLTSRARGLKVKDDSSVVFASSKNDFENRFTPTSEPEPIFIDITSLDEIKAKKISFASTKLTYGKWKIAGVKFSISGKKKGDVNWDTSNNGEPDPLLRISLYNKRAVDSLTNVIGKLDKKAENYFTSVLEVISNIASIYKKCATSHQFYDTYEGNWTLGESTIITLEPGQAIQIDGVDIDDLQAGNGDSFGSIGETCEAMLKFETDEWIPLTIKSNECSFNGVSIKLLPYN